MSWQPCLGWVAALNLRHALYAQSLPMCLTSSDDQASLKQPEQTVASVYSVVLLIVLDSLTRCNPVVDSLGPPRYAHSDKSFRGVVPLRSLLLWFQSLSSPSACCNDRGKAFYVSWSVHCFLIAPGRRNLVVGSVAVYCL